MTKSYAFFGLAAALSLSAFACSDDETTTTTAPTTTTTGTGGSSSTTTGTGGTTTTTTGVGGNGGSAAGGASAAAFCSDYEADCGFGETDRFADEASCVDYYDGASAGCLSCIEEHLGFVSSMGAQHCPHACGAGPCAGACGTSGCQ